MAPKIYFLAEHTSGAITPAGLDLAIEAKALSKKTGYPAAGLLLGDKASLEAEQLAKHTGLDVYLLEHPSLQTDNTEAYRAIISAWLKKHPARITLFSHSSLGWDIAPAIAMALKASYISGVIKIDINGTDLSCTRQALYGKRHEVWRPIPGRPIILTVMAAKKTSPDPSFPASGKVYRQQIDPGNLKTRVLGLQQTRRQSQELTKASIVIAAGRGAGNKEALAGLQELVSLLDDAALGASRPLCDKKWLPLEQQIGLTGQKVSPRLYMACGISGALQHLAGMQDSQCVVAINTDPHAPIFRAAHYGIVEELMAFLPVLLERLKMRKGLSI